IDKAINIINDGAGTASILVPQGETGVFVKDPFYEARVYLRGLTIEGANVGSTGVFVAGARAGSVENCVIRNLFGGILFEPESSNVASNKPFMAQSALTVANTTIADIGGVAVLILPGDIGVVKAALRGVRVFNNLQMGIQVLGGASRHPIDVAISDSLVTQNGQGIVANTSTTQAPVKVMVTGGGPQLLHGPAGVGQSTRSRPARYQTDRGNLDRAVNRVRQHHRSGGNRRRAAAELRRQLHRRQPDRRHVHRDCS